MAHPFSLQLEPLDLKPMQNTLLHLLNPSHSMQTSHVKRLHTAVSPKPYTLFSKLWYGDWFTYHALENVSETFDALVDLSRVRVRKIKTNSVRATAIRKERAAGHKR